MAAERYDFKEVEARWQRFWDETRLFRAPEKPGRKDYVLEMFAYPSGDIHMGHFRNYSVGDAIARHRMMLGHDVLHPFGWDAFGLPAENAAIKRGIHPSEWTLRNIETGRNTLKALGISYDWEREIITCAPDYYRWSQWLFLLLHRRGLAYRGKSFVNWCYSCKTVLANEQVRDGACERCKETVGKRELEQWFFRITDYARRLLDGLDGLPGWPESVKAMQRNWIGRSEGCRVLFPVDGEAEPIEVFTTRPDTLYGVTMMAVAPESPWARRLSRGTPTEGAVEAYIAKSMARSEIDRVAEGREKDGVDTGRTCRNPLSGEAVRIFVADYVLAGYGTGIVMGVPAHDQRDFEFARKYGLPVKVVIRPPDHDLDPATMTAAFVEPGVMANSGPFDGLPSTDGIAKVAAHLAERGIGGPTTVYRLRDWLISRQRYWGTPIPMIHCPHCGVVPVPEAGLPVLLPPDVKDFLPKGRSPLEDVEEFMNVACPACGAAAKRDPDTMDTFMCSSWYMLRYADARNDREIFSREAAKAWLPIDLYIGGVEHATGHLIYFRFLTKVLKDAGLLDFDEPALTLVNHGMVRDADNRVMSKSLGNVVSPVHLMGEHGVDTLRLAMFFFAPTRDDILWNEEAVFGAKRFLGRLFDTMAGLAPHVAGVAPVSSSGPLSPAGREVRRKCHLAIRRVSEGFEGDFKLNTGIAAIMEFVNELRSVEPAAIGDIDLPAYAEAARTLTRIAAPIVPHLAEEFHRMLGGEGSVFQEAWPVHDPAAAESDEVEVPVQVNGKLRGRITVGRDASEEEIVSAAQRDENVSRHLEGHVVAKVIHVPGRLVNIVAKPRKA
jgi:leucyl-tRNA synthetase